MEVLWEAHMKLLIVDDEPHNLNMICQVLREALEADLTIAETVSDAISALSNTKFDLVITDIFIPMGKNFREYMGPRARKYEDNMRHLGGLALLDDIEKMAAPPKVLAHTACTDFALLEVLGDHVIGRIPKPAPIDVFIKEIHQALKEEDEWSL